MKDVYGRLSEADLLPRERDAVSGRLTARRDDKRREQERSARRDTHGSRAAWSSRWWVAGFIALVLLVAAGSFALAGRGPQASTTAPPVVGPAASTAAPSVSSAPTEAAATAILLEYRGGELTRNECSDASGNGECTYFETVYDPLTVRCTAQGCIASVFGGRPVAADQPASVSGEIPAPEAVCKPTRWTIELTPVGESVTEGLRHPARLIGTATVSRPAELVGGFSCLGAEEAYRYDAAPS